MAAVDDNIDIFKAEFKKFKTRERPLDFSEVVDLNNKGHTLSAQNVERVEPVVPNVPHLAGLLPVQDWEINRFHLHDGFYLIKNPFLPGFQRYWVHRCLVDLPKPPNVTNLRVHPDINPHTVWTEFVKGQNEGKGLSSASSLRKLRWTTIGYHYDWDTKEYKEDHYTSFPMDIGLLAWYAAAALGFHNFRAEAGIVNYYHLDSTLGGHTDHSELDHDAPLISISFGQDAIFLLGGPTKATKPTAILLHSGDICVMSGPSRLAYHAVPRILTSQAPAAPSCFFVPQEQSQSQCEKNERQMGRNSAEMQSVEAGVPKSLSVDIAGDVCVSRGDDCVSKENAGIHESSAGRDLNPLVHGAISNVDSTCDCMHKEAGQCIERRNLGLQKEQNQNKGHTCHFQAEQTGSFFNDQKNEFNLENIGQPIEQAAHDSRDHFSGILSDHNEKTTDSSPQEYTDVINNVNENIQVTMKAIEWGPLSVYLSSSRLNVNIRQVLKPGQVFPSKTMLGAETTPNKRLRINQD